MGRDERGFPVRRSIAVGGNRIAYVDEGAGPAVLLLHGCPFSGFVWRHVIAELGARFRCVAPDLLGLGDTETPAGADWRLPAQTAAVLGLLDELGLNEVAVVGHDQGGAIAQLLAAHHPDRVSALVLADAEACDNWPSAEELPFVRSTQLPLAGRMVLWAWSRRRLFRWALREFDKPKLLIWGERDVHFPPVWGERLLSDIPGAQRLEILEHTGHLVMEERPARFAALLTGFLDQSVLRPEG